MVIKELLVIQLCRILFCVTLVFSCAHSLVAAESSDETTEVAPVQNDTAMIRSQGEVDGYQSLSVADQHIPATFLEDQVGDNYGAVILLHDAGQDIDSLGVISTLRHQLTQSGWSSLTVQLDYPYDPNILLSASIADDGEQQALAETGSGSANNQTETPDEQDETTLPVISNQQRLEAALAFLQAKNIRSIVLLGHGQGGVMAVELLDVVKIPMMGLILVATPSLGVDEPFVKMEQPILDVYGERDESAIIDAAQHRKMLMRRNGNTNYYERSVASADHDFVGVEAVLTATVRGWLKTHFVQQEK